MFNQNCCNRNMNMNMPGRNCCQRQISEQVVEPVINKCVEKMYYH